MSNFKWCHGPECHEKKTQDRIRGVKGSKVLRTKKIAETQWNRNNVWSHFCSQGCWNDFMHEHWNEFINLHPRNECKETPITNPVKTQQNNGYGYTWTNTTFDIIGVDNA